MEKIDLLTGEKFEAKRRNQKFSNPKNRIAYNNKKAAEVRNDKAFLDKPAHQTYMAIKKIMVRRSFKIVNRFYLEGAGVDFKSFNHYVLYEGRTHPCIYEYMFIKKKDSDNYKIIKL